MILWKHILEEIQIFESNRILCLAGGELTHKEVLSVMTKGVKEYKRFAQMQKHIEID